jgi:hypothetical protein
LERTKRKGERSMEKRAIEKRSGKEWVNTNMQDLSSGDEFRYVDQKERTFVVVGQPFRSVNEHNEEVWTVEVQDD